MAVLVINHDFEVVYANHYIGECISGMPQSVMVGLEGLRVSGLDSELSAPGSHQTMLHASSNASLGLRG